MSGLLKRLQKADQSPTKTDWTGKRKAKSLSKKILLSNFPFFKKNANGDECFSSETEEGQKISHGAQ